MLSPARGTPEPAGAARAPTSVVVAAPTPLERSASDSNIKLSAQASRHLRQTSIASAHSRTLRSASFSDVERGVGSRLNDVFFFFFDTPFNTPSGKDTPKPLHKCRVLSYSVGHFLNDMCAACWFSYLLVFLQKVIMLSPTHAGIVMFSGQAADAVGTLVVGLLSDKTRGCPRVGLGRRKSWNFGGVLFVAVCFLFVFGYCVPCDVEHKSAQDVPVALLVPMYSLSAALFNVGWASVQVSHMSLVPELTPVASEQVLLNSGRYGFTILANLSVFVFFFILLHFVGGPGFGYHGSKFTTLAQFVVGLGGVASAAFLLGTREPDFHGDKERDQRLRATSRVRACTERAGKRIYMPPDQLTAQLQLLAAQRQCIACSSPVLRTVSGDSYVGRRSPVSGQLRNPVAGQFRTVSTDSRTSFTSEALHAAAEAAATSSGTLPSLRKEMGPTDWLRRGQFYTVGFIYMCTRLTVNLSQVYIPFYVLDSTNLAESQVALIPFIVYLSSLFSTFATKVLNQKLGRRGTYILGVVFVIAGCCCLYWATVISPILVYVGVVLVGWGNSAVMVTSISLEADLIGRNVESGAFVFGALSLTDKLSNGTAILVIQHLSSVIGDPAQYSRYVLAFVPGTAALLGLIMVLMSPLPSVSTSSHAKVKRKLKRRGASTRQQRLAEKQRLLSTLASGSDVGSGVGAGESSTTPLLSGTCSPGVERLGAHLMDWEDAAAGGVDRDSTGRSSSLEVGGGRSSRGGTSYGARPAREASGRGSGGWGSPTMR